MLCCILEFVHFPHFTATNYLDILPVLKPSLFLNQKTIAIILTDNKSLPFLKWFKLTSNQRHYVNF